MVVAREHSAPLAKELKDVLAAHRVQLMEVQAPGFSAGWVFPSSTGTLIFGPSLSKPLKRALKAAGIEKRFSLHGFRYTFNNLVRQVTSGEVVRSITGHSSEKMTEHYSHVGVAEKQKAVSQMLRLVMAERP